MLRQVRLQAGGSDCAEVTLVTLEVILQGVVIGQEVAIELQPIDSFNYFNLPKRRFKLVKLIQFFCSSFLDYLLWFHLGSACKLVWNLLFF